MIRLMVDQFLVVAGTPSSVSMKLFGKPKKPFFLRRLTTNTSRPCIATTSRASLGERRGRLFPSPGSWDRKAT